MTPRIDHIHDEFIRWLESFQAPTLMRHNEQAMREEANALVRAVSRNLPSQCYEDALKALLRKLERSLRTRAWPTVQEIEMAAKATKERLRRENTPDTAEESHLNALENFFRKNGTELKAIGAPDRTQILVERGLLESLREARHFGFTLDNHQAALAQEQPIGPADREHNTRVMKKLKEVQNLQAGYGAPAAGPVRSKRVA